MATEDILINDGDSFISLTELTAAQVDCNLPIESTDGSVALESTGDKEFQITIGSQSRVRSKATIPLSVNTGLTTTGATLQKWLYSSDESVQAKFNMDLQQAVGSSTVSYAFVVTDNSVTAEALRIGKDEFTVSTGGAERVKVDAAGNLIANVQIQTPSITGLVPASDAEITLGSQATLKAGDGSEYVPTNSASIATKKTVDDKIWVGTTAAYNALATKNPTTLYCLTD